MLGVLCVERKGSLSLSHPLGVTSIIVMMMIAVFLINDNNAILSPHNLLTGQYCVLVECKVR